MRMPRRSPLFSAVVLAGASLTSAGACGGAEEVPGSADAATGTGADATSTDTGQPNDAADAGQPKDAACPPDSEIPTPPCAFIR